MAYKYRCLREINPNYKVTFNLKKKRVKDELIYLKIWINRGTLFYLKVQVTAK